jgi:hypothetical protein
MESSTEVLRVTAAIVSAFQTAADTLELIKERKEKKRRKKDRDVEELLEIRILHKSLIEVNVPTSFTELSVDFDLTIGWDEMPQTLREQTTTIQSCFRSWR